MKTLRLILLICVVSTSLNAQLVNYSNKKRLNILADKTTLSIAENSVNPTPNLQKSGVAALAGIILPPAIDYVAAAVEANAAKNAKKYLASYACMTSNDHFYAAPDEYLLPDLTVKRVVKTRRGKDVTAVCFHLKAELSADKMAFRYALCDSFNYAYSIVKTTGKYDYINLNLVIKVKSLSVQKDAYVLADLRTTSIQVPMIAVGNTSVIKEPFYSGWIPLPPASTVKVAVDSLTTQKAEVTDKWVNSVKKESVRTETATTNIHAFEYRRITGKTGLYEIEVTATETNPFKIRAEEKHAFTESTSDAAADVAKAGVEAATETK